MIRSRQPQPSIRLQPPQLPQQRSLSPSTYQTSPPLYLISFYPSTSTSTAPTHSYKTMAIDCDNNSEFDFRWNGPSSLLDWSCKALLLVIYSLMTCIEIIFCGRWRDFWPFYRPSNTSTQPGQASVQSAREADLKDWKYLAMKSQYFLPLHCILVKLSPRNMLDKLSRSTRSSHSCSNFYPSLPLGCSPKSSIISTTSHRRHQHHLIPSRISQCQTIRHLVRV